VNALYSSSLSNELDIQGQIVFDQFDSFIELSICHRQQGDDSVAFRRILDNVANGSITDEDYRLLRTRRSAVVVCRCGIFNCHRCIETQAFDTAVKLFAVNDKVDEANKEFLGSTGNPVAKIVASNSPEIGAADKKKGSGLKQVLFLSIGCRVMLRRNIAVQCGLVNGSLGTLAEIRYADGVVPPALPQYVLVKFDRYEGPCLIRDLFPIVPVKSSWKQGGVTHTRTQLPLSVAHAMTVHKAQGLTLPKAVVELEDNERAVGLTYVQLSRVPKLSDLLIQGYFSKSRFDDISKIPGHRDLIRFLQKYWPH